LGHFASGTKEEAIRRIFSGAVPKQKQRETAGERYDFFMSLKPIRFVFGKSGFRRYFGAKIEENLIIFENMEYGNAIYILFDKWEEMSKRSRLELLSGKFGTDFFRVVHKDGWEETVRSYISEKRNRHNLKLVVIKKSGSQESDFFIVMKTTHLSYIRFEKYSICFMISGEATKSRPNSFLIRLMSNNMGLAFQPLSSTTILL
jgi:hypothetical protein